VADETDLAERYRRIAISIRRVLPQLPLTRRRQNFPTSPITTSVRLHSSRRPKRMRWMPDRRAVQGTESAKSLHRLQLEPGGNDGTYRTRPLSRSYVHAAALGCVSTVCRNARMLDVRVHALVPERAPLRLPPHESLQLYLRVSGSGHSQVRFASGLLCLTVQARPTTTFAR